MASAAEQLAANVNLSAFAKAEELKKRLWFTLGALIIYRLCSYVPLPGIDPVAVSAIFTKFQGGIGGMLNMFTGGALERMSIIALNIMPYISASIIIQIVTTMSPAMASLKKEGEAGRKKINQYTRYGTVLLTAVQGYGIAAGLQASGAAIEPGPFFIVTTVTCLVAGTMFLMWLGEQITQRGVGNGVSLIIYAGIVAHLPTNFVQALEMGRTGQLSAITVIALIVLVAGLVYGIVHFERAQRRVLVQYPKRQQGNRMMQSDSSHLPIKLNIAGVIPPIFASSILGMPVMIAQFATQGQESWLGDVVAYLGQGQPLHMLLYAGLIIFFCFFYTAIVFNPDETADNLKKYGGFIPGIRPGQHTSDYLDRLTTRLTVMGAGYLVVLCLIPEFLIGYYAIPFYLGGTSVLIVVNVAMDTVSQIHSHLLAHQYEGLIKKARLRGARK